MTAPHGTRYRYAAGCTCTGCYTARRAWLNRRARKRAMGQSAYVPAGPVRAHVRSLMDAGMGYPQVAKVSGVDQSSLIYLMCGKSTRTGTPPAKVSAANARALLAVTPPRITARRIHDLLAEHDAHPGDVDLAQRLRGMLGGWKPDQQQREAS